MRRTVGSCGIAFVGLISSIKGLSKTISISRPLGMAMQLKASIASKKTTSLPPKSNKIVLGEKGNKEEKTPFGGDRKARKYVAENDDNFRDFTFKKMKVKIPTGNVGGEARDVVIGEEVRDVIIGKEARDAIINEEEEVL
ncbi:hypothetical protein HHK36_017741 [Tetracentron sinense]|uniref:Uncharacterized protein n=1 Tax=Tetracentron sinense TaxID=13715 RepID=A0A834YUR1_TETSI|nr:hypothetical protein HHK36_017741 [Tetracentron sinense]